MQKVLEKIFIGKTLYRFPYKVTSFGVAVIDSDNFVHRENIQKGVRKFKELRKQRIIKK